MRTLWNAASRLFDCALKMEKELSLCVSQRRGIDPIKQPASEQYYLSNKDNRQNVTFEERTGEQ